MSALYVLVCFSAGVQLSSRPTPGCLMPGLPTHLVQELNVGTVCIVCSICRCPAGFQAHSRVFYAWAAHSFSAGIKCWHYMFLSVLSAGVQLSSRPTPGPAPVAAAAVPAPATAAMTVPNDDELTELRSQLAMAQAEVKRGQAQLAEAKKHVAQYKSVASSIEQNLKEQNQTSKTFKEAMEAQVEEAKNGRDITTSILALMLLILANLAILN